MGDGRPSDIGDGVAVLLGEVSWVPRQVAVLDEGTGVPDDQLEAIFARFHRAEGRGRGAGPGGMGLGLAICRGIVAAHGGRIWAENRPSRPGAALRFTLPLAAAPAPAAA